MTNLARIPSLDELATLSDAAARGRALERVVADLFRRRHFTVIVNSHTARPRQTDLLAVKVAERFLVECKWQNRKATVHDLDGLRSRLHRTSPEVVGLLVSMHGFTEEVLVDVRYQRHQPVLLLSGDELRDIEAGFRHSLPDLLFRKKESLLRDAHVLLDEPRTRRSRVRRLPYPVPDRRFVSSEGVESLVYVGGGDFGRLAFTHDLPDIDWTSSSGVGVTLDIQLDVGDQIEFIDAIDTLVDLGWTTEDGRWSIQQSDRNWHGLGAQALITELPLWRHRTGHHSEEAVYVDRCDSGFYTLSVNLAAHPSRRASMTELSFQLEGLPLDSAPLLHLSRALGVHDDLRVRPRTDRSRKLVHLRGESIGLNVRGFVVTDDPYEPNTRGPWTSGIITDNPYLGAASREAGPLPDGLEMLARSEILLCELRQYHLFHEPRTSYYLDKLEWAWTSDTVVCRPIADWPYAESRQQTPNKRPSRGDVT